MAADCRPRQMPRPACACGIESRQHYRCLLWQYSARTWGSRLHIRSRGLMRGKYNYGHALASAQWTVSSRRQCRTNLVMVPQTTPAAGSGRPHDVRKGIIRRQGGRLPRCSIQRVRMGLRATGSPCLSLSCDLAPLVTSCRICRARSGTVAVRGHLLRGKRRSSHSAGQAGRRHHKLRQPPN